MSIGSIVDLLSEVPEAVGVIKRIVERIRNARGEDRAAILAAIEREMPKVHAAFEDAQKRLEDRFPDEARAARRDEPTRPIIRDAGNGE